VDAEALQKYYSGERVTVLSVQGRSYPVDVFYLASPAQNYWESMHETLMQLHESQPPGVFLAFLTGVEDIEKVGSLLRAHRGLNLEVLPLHAALSIEQQMEVFRRPRQGVRRVVLSTNIAESSVTLEGVSVVVDCCFVKLKCYDSASGIESCVLVSESQSQAEQRAGRAGRTRPGKCYRLCTEQDFSTLRVKSAPEIQRSDLTPMLLYLKSIGIDNFAKFEFLDPAPDTALRKALEVLYSLGAIDDQVQLTEDIGYQLAELPVEPRLGVMLLNSCKDDFHCSEEMLSIVAMLSVTPIFTSTSQESVLSTKRRLGCKEGDHVTLLNIYNLFHKTHSFQDRKQLCKDHRLHMRALQRAGQLRDQLRNVLRRLKKPIVSCECDVEVLLRCLTTGLFMNAAQRTKGNMYRTVKGEALVKLMPSSIATVKHPPWVVYSEVLYSDAVYINEVSEIDADWLSELAPHYFQDTRAVRAKLQHKRQAIGPEVS
jgi:ATP-dependent RNA helicase DDX35